MKKTVFITGSGKRIGRALAYNFAELGWNVAVHYNSSENEANKTFEYLQKFDIKSTLVKADIQKYNEIKKAIYKAKEDLGEIDVLINNAGVFPPKTPINDIDSEFWDFTLNINLRGEFFVSKIFSEFAKSGSKIINFASLGAFEIWKHKIPYNVSKAGVIQLTKALARELAPNIAVNSISPGTINIPNEIGPEPNLISTEKIPMGRHGNTDDIFEAVYFFATCSNFITGQNISVDGGYHLSR